VSFLSGAMVNFDLSDEVLATAMAKVPVIGG
jgi:hypothetical protein